MITELSKRISLFLCRKNIIDEDLIEVYQYGFETIISTLLGFFITVIIGIVFRMTLLSLLYYFIFVILHPCIERSDNLLQIHSLSLIRQ